MPIKADRVLLLEGREDQEVIYQFCNYHKLDNKNLFTTIPKDGYEQLRDDLSVRPRTGIKVLGAIIDADVDLAQRWQSIRDALGKAGYANVPVSPDESGTIISSGDPALPRVGIWVMPDNRLTGMLEDFLQQLINQGDGLLIHAQATVDALPERRFQAVHRSKSVIHTWLAWQQNPGTPLGHAITRHYLDAHHELALRFLTWLKKLFVSG